MTTIYLKKDKIYLIQCKSYKAFTCIGTFSGYKRRIDKKPSINAIFINLTNYANNEIYNRFIIYHYTNYYYYDLEEIKINAKKARQNMEKRALDLVLKRLVNKHFEW